MQCPNPRCKNRALIITADTETLVQFKEDGRSIDTVEHGEWYIQDTSPACCKDCEWRGSYADCKESTDISG